GKDATPATRSRKVTTSSVRPARRPARACHSGSSRSRWAYSWLAATAQLPAAVTPQSAPPPSRGRMGCLALRPPAGPAPAAGAGGRQTTAVLPGRDDNAGAAGAQQVDGGVRLLGRQAVGQALQHVSHRQAAGAALRPGALAGGCRAEGAAQEVVPCRAGGQ